VSTAHDRSRKRLFGTLALGLVLGLGAFVSVLPAAGAPGAANAKRSTIHYPLLATLTDARIAHWAPVVREVGAHTLPKMSSHTITRVATVTGDGTQNIVLILGEDQVKPGQTWYRVRLAILPNNSTGWVPASALGDLYTVDTHLYVDRETQIAVLKRNGVTVFTTRIGVGEPYWPTPAGQFYIRDKLTNFDNPFYGPVAFGTSARSAVLTDWPGGGFIGVHGTNEPQILPGRVSHGCIRLVNTAILQLAKMLKVGTPLTIT
jgi:hypothetical protein